MAQNSELSQIVTVNDNENRWFALAKTHWLEPAKAQRAKPDFIKREIWDPLSDDGFHFRSLLMLENLNLLERFLWPTYSEDASNHHVLLIALIISVKQRENLPIWEHFTDRPSDFSTLFHRILSMSIDQSLAPSSRYAILLFIISGFQSLEHSLIRKECAPLVSISIWHNLHSDATRDRKLEKSPILRKAWRAAGKRFEAADDSTKAKIRFERSWLYTLLLDFIQKCWSAETQGDNVYYCERFLELLVDLDSQLPTRRYVNSLFHDLNLLPLIRHSPLYKDPENTLIRDFFALLQHFAHFAVDDYTGEPLSAQATYRLHCQRLAQLQRTAIRHFKDKLTILALANYGSIEQRSELESHLSPLDISHLQDLCGILGLRTKYPKQVQIELTKEIYLEILISYFEKKLAYQESAAGLSVVPTEDNLYDAALLRNESYDGSRPLALPKLNLQYLSLGDFLWRSFILYRSEAFFEIRKDLESVVKRMQPRVTGEDQPVAFDGFSRMAIPIPKPAIIEVGPPKVASTTPAFVRAEITLEVGRLSDNIRMEWDSLRPDDAIFLLAVRPTGPPIGQALNGVRNMAQRSSVRLTHVRTAEIVQILDENGRVLREPQARQENGYPRRPRIRRLLVNLDAATFKADTGRMSKGKPDIYPLINVVVRRRARENNFKPILETMQKLTISDICLPSWFQEVFLGYGDPASSRYTELSNSVKSVDFRDTFLDWQHLVESFPGKTLEPLGNESSNFSPPYVLEMGDSAAKETAVRESKKRRRGEVNAQSDATIKVSTYRPPNPGPYPVDVPKLNSIRFTPAQIEAISSGTQPGLTIIVGPPGTGKTDVATQIINNIYHNFPNERTLLVAHSNQALNQLFQKIVALDIDERHLLRLGHGEEELDTNSSYSKYGRVESFFDNRARLLTEVGRLAASMDAQGAHGNSCETAGYFNNVYVQPAWTKFWEKTPSASPAEIIEIFPFHSFFSNVPEPLFDASSSKENILDVATGCQRHIDKVFSELEDIRPFEILRLPKDRANYLLVKEARIIAMTSTHAAMRCQSITDLGFHYDNVIMEEAAQITEIETFIPSALQGMVNDELPLKRVVLCGDHLQNSPIVQNLAFRHYANFEQSLFLRLIRLGVPTITLNQQGRTRPDIAALFKWRYPQLGNLPHVEQDPEYKGANAGFQFDYQFINVSDYQGQGEREPSPHFIQNLGEAEYSVALYQYMRLLGYPPSKISILTTYSGQRALIKDVLNHRCAKNPLFGLPKIITTVDKYQGEQNDYIILSLVRTRTVGYLRDVRRLTVALSRARLGLYILGRRDVFERCLELKPAFDILGERPNKLMLTTGEMFPTTRTLDETVEGTAIEGVEHLGQYVFEMTDAKIKALGKDRDILNELPSGEDFNEDEDEVMLAAEVNEQISLEDDIA